jgi:hypothetical protein
MSQPIPNNSGSKDSGQGKPVLVPPEEKFWKRYSPQHEFPISSVTSICIYALAILGAWALVAYAINRNEDNKSLPVGAIEIGGGGGSPDGEGTKGTGDLPPPPKKEVASNIKPEPDATAKSVPPDEKLVSLTPDPLDLPELQNTDSRVISEAAEAARDKLGKMSQTARKQLFEGLGPSKGLGGSGEGGGKGKGKGIGEGDGEGPGKGKMSVRQKRVLRWVMMFNTVNGNDYLTQLRELGAILAIPNPTGGYLVIRELRPPIQGKNEELASIQRIFWIDDKPESVASLSRALALPQPPPHVVAFFPEKLEKELLDKELKYQRRKEEDIKETRFRVQRIRGKYVPVVDSQS